MSKLESGTYTLREVAIRVGLSLSTVYELRQRGELPFPVLKLGGQYRCRVADVEAFLDSHMTSPNGQEGAGGS